MPVTKKTSSEKFVVKDVGALTNSSSQNNNSSNTQLSQSKKYSDMIIYRFLLPLIIGLFIFLITVISSNFTFPINLLLCLCIPLLLSWIIAKKQ